MSTAAVEMTPEGVDKMLHKLEKAFATVCAAKGSKVMLPTAEINLLTLLEQAREVMLDALIMYSRDEMLQVFGGSNRVARVLTILDQLQLSPMNADDQRVATCRGACESLEEVLRDLEVGSIAKEAACKDGDKLAVVTKEGCESTEEPAENDEADEEDDDEDENEEEDDDDLEDKFRGPETCRFTLTGRHSIATMDMLQVKLAGRNSMLSTSMAGAAMRRGSFASSADSDDIVCDDDIFPAVYEELAVSTAGIHCQAAEKKALKAQNVLVAKGLLRDLYFSMADRVAQKAVLHAQSRIVARAVLQDVYFASKGAVVLKEKKMHKLKSSKRVGDSEMDELPLVRTSALGSGAGESLAAKESIEALPASPRVGAKAKRKPKAKGKAKARAQSSTDAGMVTDPEPEAMPRIEEVVRFEIEIDRSGGAPVGIGIDKSGFNIKSVLSTGLVADWNAANPDKAVKAGDSIVAINGKTGVQGIYGEFKVKQPLRIELTREVIRPPPPAPPAPTQTEGAGKGSRRRRRSRSKPCAVEAKLLCMIGCGRLVAPGRTRYGQAFETCCRGCATGKGHDELCGTLNPDLCGPGLCKKGCGRRVATGRDRSGQAFDTCCRGCAVGKAHDKMCGMSKKETSRPFISIEGNGVFREARKCLPHVQFNEMLTAVRQLNSQQRTPEQTLKTVRDILLGADLPHLSSAFECLIYSADGIRSNPAKAAENPAVATIEVIGAPASPDPAKRAFKAAATMPLPASGALLAPPSPKARRSSPFSPSPRSRPSSPLPASPSSPPSSPYGTKKEDSRARSVAPGAATTRDAKLGHGRDDAHSVPARGRKSQHEAPTGDRRKSRPSRVTAAAASAFLATGTPAADVLTKGGGKDRVSTHRKRGASRSGPSRAPG